MGKRSSVWNHFTVKDDTLATCDVCHRDFSYKASVSNLKKHWLKKHHNTGQAKWEASDDETDTLPKDLNPSFKKYFSSSARENVVHCRLCDEDVVATSGEGLEKHVREEHRLESENEQDSDEEERADRGLLSYFKRRARQSIATCVLCQSAVSYRNGSYYLKRHLKIKHPTVKIECEDDPKTIIISANGELYEVETEDTNQEDDQTDPIDMDAVYLEEFEDIANVPKSSAKNFVPKTSGAIQNRRQTIGKKICRPVKRKVDENTEEEEENKMDIPESLECFGKYLCSILKDLPKLVSDRLQSDMIRQAIDAKINYEAAKNDSVGFQITVLDNSVKGTLTDSVSEMLVSNSDVEGCSSQT